jgi:hypothetical protein
MRRVDRVGVAVGLCVGVVACQGETATLRASVDSATAPVAAPVSDSIPDERPDTIPVAVMDSATVLLALLPAAAGGALGGEAESLAERAVFVPRTQRWFMARMIDSAPSMDIGRIDGGIGTTDADRVALTKVLAERSPITPGMSFILHARGGSRVATVTGLTTSGRRIIARLDVPAFDSGEVALPVEWRGAPAIHPHAVTRADCPPGDSIAIERSIAKFVPSKDSAVSVLRGCFGRFRALVTVRPTTITPESGERVILVKPNGGMQRGRLRDLSYPLHALVSVLDIDGDGTQEIVVHSFRPAMETWAALRMTDSVAFTRFASGFTVEKR